MQQERRQPGSGQPGPGTGRAALAAAAVVIWQVWRRKQAAAHSAPAACWTWADEAEEDLSAGGEE